MNTAKLIKKCANNNAKAQSILYEKYVGLLYSTVFRYIKNDVATEDVLLQAFLKIFNQIKEFKYINEKAFVGWMKKIAINESLMVIRKEFSSVYKVENVEEFENALTVTSEIIDEKELLETVEQLPDGYRTVFLLYVVDGYSHKEIAESLRITESTSRSQFFKARNLLQKKLSSYYGKAVGK